jgi:hypothetical protein
VIYEGPIQVSAAEAAHLFDVPVGTIRRWAHEDGWTPHGPRHRRRWELDQVQASYDRRRAHDTRACG